MNKNLVACPKFSYGDGYAQRVESARKAHKCNRCGKIIQAKTPYISVHNCVDNFAWSSYPLCEECHAALIAEQNSEPIDSRITVAYFTSDGIKHDTMEDAVKHEDALEQDKSLIMFAGNGLRTQSVLLAKVIYVVDETGIIALRNRFIGAFAKTNQVPEFLGYDPYRGKVDIGVYVWSDLASKFIKIDSTAVKAFCALYNYRKAEQE